jgi:hypothetical protein
MNELLDERESLKKAETLVISEITDETMQSLLRKLGVSLIDGSEDVSVVSQTFHLFIWKGYQESN